jgi:NarL family two-component system response regulator LiaR
MASAEIGGSGSRDEDYAEDMGPQCGRPVRVAVVDDYEIVLAGTAAVLAPYDDRVRLVEFDTSRRPTRRDVDIVLYDTFGHTHEHDLDILALTSATTKVVMFSWNLEPERINRALSQGAAGYLAKSLTADEIVSALERVHAGETIVANADAIGAPHEVLGWPGGDAGLSRREAEVVALIAKGLSNREIADHLYLSINSVKTYIRSAYQKMGVVRRSQAVAWAIGQGFSSETASDEVYEDASPH